MFRDYSKEIEEIKDLLQKTAANVEKVERLLSGTSDDINEIRSHLGLVPKKSSIHFPWREGRRTNSDITLILQQHLKMHWESFKNTDFNYDVLLQSCLYYQFGNERPDTDREYAQREKSTSYWKSQIELWASTYKDEYNNPQPSRPDPTD